MSLVADYSSSSSVSDSDDSSDVPEQSCAKTKESKSMLPSANHLLQNSSLKTKGQVLINPFREAENAKIALLEKHVKMVSKDEHLTEKNGRKICWNYRKGRCRFGSKCSFAHDSDVSTSQSLQLEENAGLQTTQNTNQQHLSQQTDLQDIHSDIFEPAKPVEKKRKRPGLGDSVVPSKKVINSYMQGKYKKSTP